MASSPFLSISSLLHKCCKLVRAFPSVNHESSFVCHQTVLSHTHTIALIYVCEQEREGGGPVCELRDVNYSPEHVETHLSSKEKPQQWRDRRKRTDRKGGVKFEGEFIKSRWRCVLFSLCSKKPLTQKARLSVGRGGGGGGGLHTESRWRVQGISVCFTLYLTKKSLFLNTHLDSAHHCSNI